jgi:transposase
MDAVEVERLRELYGSEKEGEVKERLLMILWLRSGKSSYEIGDLLFCPHSRVIYWKKRYDEEGIKGLKTIKRPGRPREIDAIKEEEIKAELSGRDYWKSSQISSIVKEKSGVTYTKRHVRRLMQKWGYSLMTPRKKHRKAASDEEVENFKKNPQRYWALSGRE